MLCKSVKSREAEEPAKPSRMGQAHGVHKGTGRALAEERMRAEVAVKLHMAVGDKSSYRAALEAESGYICKVGFGGG